MGQFEQEIVVEFMAAFLNLVFHFCPVFVKQ